MTGILIFALVLRLIWALLQPRDQAAIARLPDQQEYLSLGRNLLHEHSLFFVDPRFGQSIWAYRMPGYPAVIAACGGSVVLVRLFQCLADTSTLLGVFFIAKSVLVRTRFRHWNAYGPLLAAFLLAVNPFYIYFSGLILSETIFTSLTIWGMYFLVQRRLTNATVLLVAACYFRPAMILMAPVIAALAMMNPLPPETYLLLPAIRRGAVTAIFVGMFTTVMLIPWGLRNHQRLGSWIWTTTNGGITMYDGFNPAATGASDQRFLAAMPAVRAMGEVDRSRFMGHAAVDWAEQHVGELPMLSLRKILRSWSPVPLSAEFGRPVYRVVSAVYAIPFDLLLLIGLFSRRIAVGAKLLLITPAVLITLIELMSVGSIRYRIPAEAPLAVLAGAGMIEVREKFE